eukprot:TRINITY_DN36491_c0_g1_i2.p1 TRINITY_DN36491_c0_g1~~TRINITY_DN36491_c0_g1_i2.p1  ORF type:complete len:494 (+),score=56.90 TRINITY_DN36491_c0_g1_i2:158-1639(+)
MRQEGASALFRGLGPSLLGIVPYSGLSFAIFETLKPSIKAHLGLTSQADIPLAWRLTAGGCAGLVAQTATYPLHVVRRRMQVFEGSMSPYRGERGWGWTAWTVLPRDGSAVVNEHPQPYRSTFQAMRHIFRSEGLVGGLYKGASLTFVKGPIAAAVGFCVNDALKQALGNAQSLETVASSSPLPTFEYATDSSSRPRPLSAVEQLCIGGTAGSVAKTVIAPADRVKILYQINAERLFTWRKALGTMNYIYSNSGLRGLWRGHGATLFRVAPYSGVSYFSFDRYKEKLRDQNCVPAAFWPLNDATVSFIGGALAGATATTCTYPLDLMRARMAAHWNLAPRYPTYPEALKRILQEEGFLSLFGGLRPTLLGIVPYSGLSFMTFECLKKFVEQQLALESDGKLPTHLRLCCGSMAGLIGQSATYPLDIVRRRMQVQNASAPLYRNEWHAFTLIYQNEGARGLFKGLSMNWVKGPVAVGVSFTLNDLLKSWLANRP